MDFDDIRERVTDLAQAGAVKAREIAEIAKLKMSSAAEEDTIRKAYIEIGKLYYAERGMAPEAPYAVLCEKVTASKEKIEYNKQKIADIKSAGNIQDEEVSEPNLTIIPQEPASPAEDSPAEDGPAEE